MSADCRGHESWMRMTRTRACVEWCVIHKRGTCTFDARRMPHAGSLQRWRPPSEFGTCEAVQRSARAKTTSGRRPACGTVSRSHRARFCSAVAVDRRSVMLICWSRCTMSAIALALMVRLRALNTWTPPRVRQDAEADVSDASLNEGAAVFGAGWRG